MASDTDSDDYYYRSQIWGRAGMEQENAKASIRGGGSINVSSRQTRLSGNEAEFTFGIEKQPFVVGPGDSNAELNDHLLWGCLTISCLPLQLQLSMHKYLTRYNGMILLLICCVIGFGTVNRVVYKIQLTNRTMGPYQIFISDILSFAYVGLYCSILAVRYKMGIVTRDMFEWRKFPFLDPRFIIMGLMDATGQILGIYSAGRISGFLLTLLPQGTVPMTMIITYVLLRRKYNWGQVLGAAILIAGIIITLVPDIKKGNGAADSIIWAIVYFLSSAPSALSFSLKEMVFASKPTMDIFVVNSMDSIFQMIFTLLFLPLVMVPGFGAVSFSRFGTYVNEGLYCLGGYSINETESSCDGMPWATLIYVCVNVSWNISILLLVKWGGAVLTFIALAVSLPLANLAFIFSWPLLPGAGFNPYNIVALVIVLIGLTVYRVFSILQKKKQDRERELTKWQSIQEEEKP